ncbi:hypothetical protein DA2_1982 [Desulfovibrio sp. A2]|nr:hypothetical protein DA2_1982 [Desulfovibrio sp. A2]
MTSGSERLNVLVPPEESWPEWGRALGGFIERFAAMTKM